jgi:hypothetical protein
MAPDAGVHVMQLLLNPVYVYVPVVEAVQEPQIALVESQPYPEAHPEQVIALVDAEIELPHVLQLVFQPV